MFVERRGGQIAATYSIPQPGRDLEWLPDDDAEVVAFMTAFDMPLAGIVPYGVFRARWTVEELAALHAARQADWRVDDFVGLAQAQGNVNLGGSVAPQAKALFVALGVLTSERADVIFDSG